MASSSTDKKALQGLLASTQVLLTQFSATLNPSNNTAPPTTESTSTTPAASPPNPLKLLSDASKLLKAHTTKLSLLAINPPFTPSAVAKVIREMTSTCLPAMMSAVEICAREKQTWGDFLCRELQTRTRRVVMEMQTLLREVEGIATNGRPGGAGVGRDSLSSTGVVWESCDALVELEVLGLAGLAVKKADQYRETLRDAIEELREWREGEDLDSEGQGDGLLDSEDEGVDGDRDSIDDIFHAANSMPQDRPELEQLVDEAQAVLKKVTILYNALVKRRLATFRAVSQQSGQNAPVLRLDRIMLRLRRIPHQVDEMATCFYDLDEDSAREVLRNCVREALSASDEAVQGWGGQDDKFSEWFRKWREAVAQEANPE